MADRLVSTRAGLTPYLALVRARLRAQRQYGASFVLDAAGSVLFGLIEFAELWIVFHNVRSLGGLDFTDMILLFGLTHTAYAAAMVVVGHVDNIPDYIRTGTMEAFYLRPLSLLGQLVTSEVQLRRLGWLSVGVASLGYGIAVSDIAWTPAHLLLLCLTLISSAAIFGAMFVSAAAVQFFLIDGREATNAFTYGGRYASQQPTSILPSPLLFLFTFVVPVAFTGYLPTLALLGRPAAEHSPWLSGALAWGAPMAAVLAWLAALGLWRVGVRHYQGGGG